MTTTSSDLSDPISSKKHYRNCACQMAAVCTPCCAACNEQKDELPDTPSKERPKPLEQARASFVDFQAKAPRLDAKRHEYQKRGTAHQPAWNTNMDSSWRNAAASALPDSWRCIRCDTSTEAVSLVAQAALKENLLAVDPHSHGGYTCKGN